MITNRGTDKRSVCWDYHDYGAKVAAGQIQDDSFFAYICALDETDDPFKDERTWHKANPSLAHGLPGIKYLREQVTQARGMPGKESIVRRLNFCQWVEAEAPWIGGDIWFQAAPEPDYDDARLYGRRCWGGLDLSSTQDLTALVLLFEPTEDDPTWRLKPYFWLPGDGLHGREWWNPHFNAAPRRPLDKSCKGHLHGRFRRETIRGLLREVGSTNHRDLIGDHVSSRRSPGSSPRASGEVRRSAR
jgi:phage terminase large subunit-like protein